MRIIAMLLLIVLASCATTQRAPENPCTATTALLDERPRYQAQAETDGEVEAWGVFMDALVTEDDPQVRIRSGLETKIIILMTGDGELQVAAVDETGAAIAPTFVEPHDDSNIKRPGDEWGTGWIFPSEGCWTLEASRQGAAATFRILVVS